MSSTEKRRSERFKVGIPIELKSGRGITRDCCVDGVFFETDQPLSVGEQVEFVMKLEYAIKGDRSAKLLCEGEVVRVEPGLEKRGVAVSIISHRFADISVMAQK